jgi:hypothetical protein
MRKIMFSDKYFLTKAVLDGTKTMTRRVLKNNVPLGNWEETEKHLPYKVGEVVAIAQSYKSIADERDEAETVLGLYKIGDNLLTMDEMGAGWNNKMFVKASLMPHHIKITDVKVECLQDILENECLKEGLRLSGNGRFYYQQMVASNHFINKYFDTLHEAFAYLIDSISGKGIWESNPFVVAYSFELVD